jgi:hypothetical protein
MFLASLVQEFIKEAEGADIRCFVIGDKVMAAMKRQGLSPGKHRQASLGAITTKLTGGYGAQRNCRPGVAAC